MCDCSTGFVGDCCRMGPRPPAELMLAILSPYFPKGKVKKTKKLKKGKKK